MERIQCLTMKLKWKAKTPSNNFLLDPVSQQNIWLHIGHLNVRNFKLFSFSEFYSKTETAWCCSCCPKLYRGNEYSNQTRFYCIHPKRNFIDWFHGNKISANAFSLIPNISEPAKTFSVASDYIRDDCCVKIHVRPRRASAQTPPQSSMNQQSNAQTLRRSASSDLQVQGPNGHQSPTAPRVHFERSASPSRPGQ